MYIPIGLLKATTGGVAPSVFPSIVSDTFTQIPSPSGAPPYVANMPPTVVAGNLLLMLIIQGLGVDPNATPAGWTQLVSGEFHGFYKWSTDGSESGGTVSVSFSSGSLPAFTVLCVQGGDTGQNPQAAVFEDTTTATPNPPSLDPSWATANNLFIVYAGTSGPRSIVSYPTNYTLHQQGYTSTETSSYVAARQLASSAAENPGVFTVSTSVARVRAYTIAVKGT